MSETSYTLKNLKEIEDATGGRAPGVEGRFARKHIDSDHLGVSLFHYAPGVRSQFAHKHREQEEVYVVVAGSGEALLDGEVLPLRNWDVLRVSPQTVRAFAAGDEGLELLAVGSDRPEDGDGEMAEAAWPGAA